MATIPAVPTERLLRALREPRILSPLGKMSADQQAVMRMTLDQLSAEISHGDQFGGIFWNWRRRGNLLRFQQIFANLEAKKREEVHIAQCSADQVRYRSMADWIQLLPLKSGEQSISISMPWKAATK